MALRSNSKVWIQCFLPFLILISKSVLSEDSFPDPSIDNPNSTALNAQSYQFDTVSVLLQTLLKNYDRLTRPNFYEGPTLVQVSLYIKRIFAVSEFDMDMSLDLYFRQYWFDERLKYESFNSPFDTIILMDDERKLVWQPDTFFENEKNSFLHSSTIQNEYVKIQRNGTVIKSSRFSMTSSCPMDLRHFPFDVQICRLTIEAYGSNVDHLIYTWMRSNNGRAPVLVHEKEGITPQFIVDGYNVSEAVSGSFKILYADVRFRRSLGFYIIQVYLPTAMLVVVSWFALFLDRNMVAERVSLGVTTILTTTMLISASNANSPKLSYVKAIDIYLGVCFAFNFLAILVNVIVAYVYRKGRKQASAKGLHDFRASSLFDIKPMTKREAMFGTKQGLVSVGGPMSPRFVIGAAESSTAEIRARKIDHAFRVLLPLLFAVFNLGYWMYYLTVDKPDGFAKPK